MLTRSCPHWTSWRSATLAVALTCLSGLLASRSSAIGALVADRSTFVWESAVQPRAPRHAVPSESAAFDAARRVGKLSEMKEASLPQRRLRTPQEVLRNQDFFAGGSCRKPHGRKEPLTRRCSADA